jgi:hypothetical protein
MNRNERKREKLERGESASKASIFFFYLNLTECRLSIGPSPLNLSPCAAGATLHYVQHNLMSYAHSDKVRPERRATKIQRRVVQMQKDYGRLAEVKAQTKNTCCDFK